MGIRTGSEAAIATKRILFAAAVLICWAMAWAEIEHKQRSQVHSLSQAAHDHSVRTINESAILETATQ